ncbi:MAG: cation transporter [Anaerolineales bacterium]|nr:cation transporter [Anaerolineales bacterium]
MSHDHSHGHSHAHHGSENIQLAFFLNLGFAILEIIGGLWTNSLAILSDALHDFGDSLSLGMAWYLERYSHKGEDATYTYGYRRFSLLGAFLNTVILLAGSLYMISQAVPRLLRPEASDAQGMLLLALVGVAVNGYGALRLRGERSMHAKVVAWHLIEDVLGWLAVLVASVVMMFTDLYILDPILSVLISLYILYNVVRNLRKTVALFLQAVPQELDLRAIRAQIEGLPGVQSTHHMHAWSLEGENHVLTMHVMVAEDAAQSEVMALRGRIRELLRDRHLLHTTIEIEYGPDDCMLGAGN